MYYSTDHTIYLQDGSLFNFKKRFKKHAQTLIQAFSQVIDGRSRFGKRHPLPLILMILFGGITAGNTTVKDCHIWALHNRKWLHRLLGLDLMPHGIPDERTLCRVIQKTDIDSLVNTFLTWRKLLWGLDSSWVASFDGKTMNGIHGKTRVKHILSLFSHKTHQILGQIGVTQKENEIPAFRRMLKAQSLFVGGMLLLGDALHTQKETVKAILDSHAYFLLFVKANQEGLYQDLELFFSGLKAEKSEESGKREENASQKAQDSQIGRGRDIKTQVTVLKDQDLSSYLLEQGWEGVVTIGKIHRFGTREEKDHRTGEVKVTAVDETVYAISSQDLSATKFLEVTRGHWCIEINVHWEKDYLFLEDRCTLRSGNAPQVMTFLRSICLSLFNLFQLNSPTQTCSNFKSSTTIHHNFLRMAGVV